jgi:TfoX/Sxy family transcriptional regulator of competence genes
VAPDNALVGRVRAALERTIHVEEKRMFGGIVFMVDGKMCVSVGRDRLMCRIDPSLHDPALERTGCRTVVMRGRRYRGYVYVESKAVRTKRDLERWIGMALDYNKTARPSKRDDRERTPPS